MILHSWRERGRAFCSHFSTLEFFWEERRKMIHFQDCNLALQALQKCFGFQCAFTELGHASLGYHLHKCISNFSSMLLGSFGSLVIINTGPLLCVRSFLCSSRPLVITTPCILNLSLPFPAISLIMSWPSSSIPIKTNMWVFQFHINIYSCSHGYPGTLLNMFDSFCSSLSLLESTVH